MRIFKGAITSLASEGMITLQIPQYVIDAPGSPPSETEEVPDEWIVKLRSNNTPATGKERGYYFLTRRGWEANRHKIEEAFSKAKFKRGTWFDFQVHVEQHFMEVKKASRKRLAYLERKANQIKNQLKEAENGR